MVTYYCIEKSFCGGSAFFHLTSRFCLAAWCHDMTFLLILQKYPPPPVSFCLQHRFVIVHWIQFMWRTHPQKRRTSISLFALNKAAGSSILLNKCLSTVLSVFLCRLNICVGYRGLPTALHHHQIGFSLCGPPGARWLVFQQGVFFSDLSGSSSVRGRVNQS